MFSNTKVLVLFLALSTSTWAQSDNQDYINYDSIIKDLTASTKIPSTSYQDPFDMIKIHGGLGLVGSYTSITTATGEHYSGFQRGLEAKLGIDLFSPLWRAEGALRSFLSSQLEKAVHATLNEFYLRLLYCNPVSQWVKLRFGMGVAARYMALNLNQAAGVVKQESSTPASILSLGLEMAITQELSIGAELAYRSTLVTEIYDSEMTDVTLSLETHF